MFHRCRGQAQRATELGADRPRARSGLRTVDETHGQLHPTHPGRRNGPPGFLDKPDCGPTARCHDQRGGYGGGDQYDFSSALFDAAKGLDKEFRGLAIFDLSTGLFIPFILATGFVVIASASQFHATPAAGFIPDELGGTVTVEPAKNLVPGYNGLLKQRLKFEIGGEGFAGLTDEQVKQQTDALPYADKKMAAMLVKRDAFNLADTLAPLTGKRVAQYIFGFGVIGMAMSAATMLMTIQRTLLLRTAEQAGAGLATENRQPHGLCWDPGTILLEQGRVLACRAHVRLCHDAIAYRVYCLLLPHEPEESPW